ncbi:hypothetical protein B1B04_05350 [Lysinibacillus sp. KCTC 33748]|uniref:hypothetical protein n=1 Tax=unclassified Lysinibacillus TaxID=2636778 RepID=UPI0009A89030|nr:MULTISPECIES: hypothetical protein [unclassified Lysinibacillus]OXS76400.1 hypothetical protein B1B04_05350 [Lysinibacillus sp. KCTC 33748]SKB45373.1 hypothetical protein SAMN06295926_102554 [Lysinibacillus sp. AC-3]
MFTKLETFEFIRFELIDISNKVFSFEISGTSKTFNSKEVSLILDSESDKFVESIKQLNAFRSEIKLFQKAILYLENTEINIPFKYVGRDELLFDDWYKNAKELGIHLLYDE